MNIREDLKAYVDGELSAERAAEVSAAINADPVLQSEIEAMKALTKQIRTFAATPEPTGMEQTLRALRRPLPWWSPIGGTGRLVWGAAATLGILIVFANVLPRAQSEMATGGDVASVATGRDRSLIESPAAGEMSSRAAPPPASESGREPGATFAKEPANEDTESPSVAASPERAAEMAEAPGTDSMASIGASVPATSLRTRVRIQVPDETRATERALAVAGPLGGSAEVADDGVVLQVPYSRREEAMRELRAIGQVETLEPEADQAKPEAPAAKRAAAAQDNSWNRVEPYATIEATFDRDRDARAASPRSESENGRKAILWSMLGIVAIGIAGILWALRRR